MQKKVAFACSTLAAVVLLGAASNYFSPYWTIYQMKQAYDRRDAAAFSAHIDFPSLRASVKTQMQAGLRDKLAARLPGQFLANLGAALVSNVADPAVDALVSPESVAQVFSSDATEDASTTSASAPLTGNPPTLSQTTASSSNATTPALQADRQAHYLIRYRDWSTVTASAIGGSDLGHSSRNPLWSPDNTLVFKRDGLWSWQLAAIEFPSGILK